MKKTRIICLLLVLVMAVSVFAGCKKDSSTGEGEILESKLGDSYPLETNETISWWVQPDANTNAVAEEFGDTEWAKEFEKQVGVDIDWVQPTGNANEQFNLLLAANDLPDLSDRYWKDFPGSGEKAVSDGYITRLNELVDSFAPNFKKFINDNNPDWMKEIKTDTGLIYSLPYVQFQTSTGGFIVRQDWLDELGIATPETIEEWEAMLVAFKEKKGAKAPLSIGLSAFRSGGLTGAHNMIGNWYVDNGKVKYGYNEPEYKDFLTTMNDWYKRGLLDKNFSVNDGKTIDAQFMNGDTGVVYGGITGGIGVYTAAAKANGSNLRPVALPFPTHKKGELPEFGQKTSVVSTLSCAIAESCKNKELAMRVLDYMYSDAGHMLHNYGVEGKSYTMVDGKPKFTDFIYNNPDGWTLAQALSLYARPYNVFSGYSSLDAYEQQLTTQDMKDAYKIWGKTNQDEHRLPPLYPTEDEIAKITTIQNAIQTYSEEMLIKFISGVEPISNFDKYLAEMKKLGIDTWCDVQQAGYDRYLNR